MTTTAQKVIDEVLRLDGEATAEAWSVEVEGDAYSSYRKAQENSETLTPVDFELINEYRSSCPKLAKALAVALEALSKCAVSHGIEKADEALSQINQIFGADDEKA